MDSGAPPPVWASSLFCRSAACISALVRFLLLPSGHTQTESVFAQDSQVGRVPEQRALLDLHFKQLGYTACYF